MSGGKSGGAFCPLTHRSLWRTKRAHMKSLNLLLSTGASILCLVLCIWLFILGSSGQGVQSELQKLQQEVQDRQQVLEGKQQQLQAQQEQINAGNTISQQVGPALLRDLATLSVKNEAMKKLLSKHGYNVEVKPDESKPGTKPETKPAPAP